MADALPASPTVSINERCAPTNADEGVRIRLGGRDDPGDTARDFPRDRGEVNIAEGGNDFVRGDSKGIDEEVEDAFGEDSGEAIVELAAVEEVAAAAAAPGPAPTNVVPKICAFLGCVGEGLLASASAVVVITGTGVSAGLGANSTNEMTASSILFQCRGNQCELRGDEAGGGDGEGLGEGDRRGVVGVDTV